MDALLDTESELPSASSIARTVATFIRFLELTNGHCFCHRPDGDTPLSLVWGGFATFLANLRAQELHPTSCGVLAGQLCAVLSKVRA